MRFAIKFGMVFLEDPAFLPVCCFAIGIFIGLFMS
jgi:hypothetical protein